jgi:hypothetical protein
MNSWLRSIGVAHGELAGVEFCQALGRLEVEGRFEDMERMGAPDEMVEAITGWLERGVGSYDGYDLVGGCHDFVGGYDGYDVY